MGYERHGLRGFDCTCRALRQPRVFFGQKLEPARRSRSLESLVKPFNFANHEPPKLNHFKSVRTTIFTVIQDGLARLC